MDFKNYLEILALMLALVSAVTNTGLSRQWGKIVTAMLLFSLLLSFFQYFSSSYTDYALDIGGHTDYIRTLARRWRLPPPFGWQNQQPPLYYALAACFYTAGVWLHIEPLYAARFLSLLLYTGFLALSLGTLRYYLSGYYFILAAGMTLFCFPDGFTYAGRISNDIGMLFSHALTFYLLTRWHFGKQHKFLHYACYSALAGLLIKGTGVIGVGAVAMVIAAAMFKKEVSYKVFLNGRLLSAAALCVGLNFGRTAYYRWVEGADIKWLINLNLSTVAGLLTQNTPYSYLYFDVPSFLRDPFFYSLPRGGIFFWNAFLKTLMFGEWFWRAGPVPAGIASGLLLIVLAYVVAYLLLKARQTPKDICFPALAMMICMLGALMAARIEVPWSAQCNGRYIFGITVIFALFFSKAIEWHWNAGRTVLVWLGIGSAAALGITSVTMIICEFYAHL